MEGGSHDNLASVCLQACGIHKTKCKSILWYDETKNKHSGFNLKCFGFGVFCVGDSVMQICLSAVGTAV